VSTPQLQLASCPSCSAAVEPTQEYCVECGSRLPRERPTPLDRAAAGLADRHPWSAGWIVPALLGLAVAVVGTGAALAISDDAQPEAAPSTATGGSLTFTGTLTAPEPPAATRPAPTPRRARPAVPRTIAWPARRRGWTIVLLSVPQLNGKAAAAERAEAARRDGLKRVGVLNSSRFASLHPGYYFVFQGVFDSQAEATSALQRARGVLRPAYVREIVP